MKHFIRTTALSAAAIAAGMFTHSASAAMLITEVNAYASSNTPYAADWFELTNTGTTAVDITGWKMDDSSPTFATSVALRGVTSIAAGQSVVFLDDSAATSATIQSSFISAWFGGNAPASLVLGFYGGSGIGLSTGGDGVTVFNSSGAVMASVAFGSSTTGRTFDNTAGLATVTQLSALGVNGAFNSGTEIGSPGVQPVPLPAAAWLLFSGLAGLVGIGRRKQASV